MVNSVVLLKVGRGLVNDVAQQLAELNGVAEVYSVGGRYDLVAILRVPSNAALADLVTTRMLQVDGILDSETLISFKVYSKHDLESMFEIGFEEK